MSHLLVSTGNPTSCGAEIYTLSKYIYSMFILYFYYVNITYLTHSLSLFLGGLVPVAVIGFKGQQVHVWQPAKNSDSACLYYIHTPSGRTIVTPFID